MRTLPLALVLAGTLVAAQVTDDAIDAAIADGTAQKVTGVIEVGSTAAGRFSVRLAGPLGRVAMAAALAQRDGEPFGRDQVTADMIGPAIQVIAHPNDPEFRVGRHVATPPAHTVVLQPRGGRNARTIVEAVRTETFPQRWGNALGAIVEGQGVIADFDRAALPAGDFEVVVRTARGEQRYRVRPPDLEQVR